MKFNISIEGTTMDKEEVESNLNKIVRKAEAFNEAPTYEGAIELDKDISILRFIIGEANFIPLDYFRRTHEAVVKFIDQHDKAKAKPQ